MNPDTDHPDAVDLLLKGGIFLCFVVFALCLWLIKRKGDQKAAKNQTPAPPKIPGN